MNETPREPSTAWWFDRKSAVLIVAGTMLTLVLIGAACVYRPYQRERQIVRAIESAEGRVVFKFVGPDWIPMLVRDRLPFWDRIRSLNLAHTRITDAGLEHLKGLSSLNGLNLYNTQVTDAGLEHLKGLTSLDRLYLNNTQVTDAGLEHLKGLSSLRGLDLDNTQVTAEGRASLRKALPNCEITPTP